MVTCLIVDLKSIGDGWLLTGAQVARGRERWYTERRVSVSLQIYFCQDMKGLVVHKPALLKKIVCGKVEDIGKKKKKKRVCWGEKRSEGKEKIIILNIELDKMVRRAM